MPLDLTPTGLTLAVANATEAANIAGDKYLATNPHWFPCGSCYVQFAAKNTALYRACKKAGIAQPTGNAVVEIPHKHRISQSHELGKVCAEAAYASLTSAGWSGLRFWSWVD